MSRATTAGRSLAGVILLLAGVLTAGCSLPGRASAPAPRIFLLQDATGEALAAGGDARACLTLRIAPPRAAPGFETPRMAYAEAPAELSYFAWHVWADTPARMLGVLVEQRLDARRLFARVVTGSPDVGTDLRLELDHVLLLQSIRGETAETRLAAKMRLVDLRERRIVSERSAQVTVPAAAVTPAAGVAAAQRATAQFLDELEQFVKSAGLPDCPPRSAADPTGLRGHRN